MSNASGLLARAQCEFHAMNTAEALRLFDAAEAAGADPDLCAGDRWTCHMLNGDFPLAWRESDRIAARSRPDPHRFWNGLPLNGNRILIRCLHGLGDTLQFIRYAPLVRAQSRSLIVEAQPALKLLLRHSEIADEVITWGDAEPPWDQQVEVVELPRIFRATLDSIPSRVPYLKTGESCPPCNASRPLHIGLLNIGFVWSCGPHNPARSLSFESLAELLAFPGARFFSLEAGSEGREIDSSFRPDADPQSPPEGVLAAARVVSHLDLVITTDTMAAHLAGALARPVWVLLPYECDWRWMLGRDDSPWYPTMRLFRQPRPGAWQPVVDSVSSALRHVARSEDASHPAKHPIQSSPHRPGSVK